MDCKRTSTRFSFLSPTCILIFYIFLYFVLLIGLKFETKFEDSIILCIGFALNRKHFMANKDNIKIETDFDTSSGEIRSGYVLKLCFVIIYYNIALIRPWA